MPTKYSNPPSKDDRTIVNAVRDRSFTALSDEEALRLLEKQFHPELERLKRAAGTIEGGGEKAQGNLRDGDRSDLTPSCLLYGQDYDEPNRTLVSFLALKWVLGDNYDAFTNNQAPAVRMEKSSFVQFRNFAFETLDEPEHVLALIVAIVVGDVGKDPMLVDEVRKKDERLGKESAKSENHDEVIWTAAVNDMLPALTILDEKLRGDVIAGLKTGSKLNIPQLAQGENVPGSLSGLSYMRKKERAFKIKYLEIIFDVAGSAGQSDSRGAMRMIEPVYQNYMTCYSALSNLNDQELNPRDAYDNILKIRADRLQQLRKEAGDNTHKSLSVDNDRDRALLRILAMGRAANTEMANLFEKAFKALDKTTQTSLIEGLSVDGVDDGEAILPYYMPAIFAESLRNVEKTARDKRLRDRSLGQKKLDAITSCLRFLTRVYGGSKPQRGIMGSVLERNVSFVVDLIKSPEFFANPKILDTVELPWEKTKPS